MSSPLDDRFSRHASLPGWNQERLRQATVVIMGLGALGNTVAQCLALAGIGKLVLCDPGRIEASNLSRTPLFRERDIGRLKVEAAARALADLAPSVTVDPRPHRLEAGVGLAELRDAALTLGCLDSRAARLELAGRCGLVRAPWIDGATGSWSGELRLYLDPQGPCYGCGQTDEARAASDDPRSCGVPATGLPAGATAPLSATIGAHMALLAVRFVMGLSVPAGLLVFDALQGELARVHQPRDPTCPYHQPIPGAVPVPIGPQHRVRELLVALGPDWTPLAWNPIQLRAVCRRCGWNDPKSRALPATAVPCPRCTAPLRARTTLEFSHCTPDVRLRDLGIPARETLAVRTATGIDFAELAGYGE